MERLCDGRLCQICITPIAHSEQACLVTVPAKKFNRFSANTKAGLTIQWDCSKPSNAFHWSCWQRVLNEVARKNSKICTIEFNLLKTVEETVERFDGVEMIRNSAKAFAKLLNESGHTVCFTGAGVSVAAGIPTYRGADGIDTLSVYGDSSLLSVKRKGEDSTAEDGTITKKIKTEEGITSSSREPTDEEEGDFDYAKLQPTLTHRMLARMNEIDKMHYCITQNCDDLHAKGGFPRTSLSELHGNVFIEFCEKCFKEYHRDYSVDAWSTACHSEPWFRKCPTCGWNHYTSRRCIKKGCHGKLKDTIVNFGDDLHETVLGGLPRAISECEKADLCVCLGSSLTVTPANSLPRMAKKIVICNLQETECDEFADLRVWATCDMLFAALAEEMNIAL